MKKLLILCALFLAGFVTVSAQNKQFTEGLMQKDCKRKKSILYSRTRLSIDA